MQKLIFLRQEYIDPSVDNLSKKEVADLQQKQFLQSIELFNAQMIGQSFKAVKYIPADAILIEYDDALNDAMYKVLCSADVVDIIDSIIPQNIESIGESSEMCGNQVHQNANDIDELKNKMAGYMK
jgi:hypothetical protein